MTGALLALVIVSAGAAAGEVPAGAVITSVDASGDVAVHVNVDASKTAKPGVTANGAVSVKLDGGKLVVTAPARSEGARPTVTVSVRELSAAGVHGTARVDIAYAGNAKSLALDADGAGVVTLSGKSAAALKITGSGTAHVDADSVSAQSVDVKLKEAARAEVWATNDLTLDLERAARLTVKGKPKSVKKTVSGVAKLVMEAP